MKLLTAVSPDRIDKLVLDLMEQGRIPGAAIAIVYCGEVVLARGYGYRDLHARLPMTPQTAFPIASTTKAMTALLLSAFIEAKRLEWDVPVQRYCPWFRLKDPYASAQVTLRDLIVMRTGLPRHDWTWSGYPIDRARLVRQLQHLEPSCGFRERFQYNNLTVMAAGYMAEFVSGRVWDDLIRSTILEPLKMSATVFAAADASQPTLSYHENSEHELTVTQPLVATVTGPSGGTIHSTVEDMARWAQFNLRKAPADAGARIVSRETLDELHSPWMAMGNVPEASRNAQYGGGWMIDTYSGRSRMAHGGYLHDVHSDVALFPDDEVGIVCATNFGAPRFSRLITEHVFDLFTGSAPAESTAERLLRNQQKSNDYRQKVIAAKRILDSRPSHALEDYCGRYANPGYGYLDVALGKPSEGAITFPTLTLHRGWLALALAHWHFDSWHALESEYLAPLESHPFDCVSLIRFETAADGAVDAVLLRLEPAVGLIRFQRVVADY